MQVTVSVKCAVCGQEHKLRVDYEKFESWLNKNILAQEAFPELSPADRELLISKTCGNCYDKMCGKYAPN